MLDVDDKEDEKSASSSGIWSSLTSLVGNKQLRSEDIEPVISKMRDHLIGKNVASDVANKLCQSVASKLEGKVIGKCSGCNMPSEGPWSTLRSFRNIFHCTSNCQGYDGGVVDSTTYAQTQSRHHSRCSGGQGQSSALRHHFLWRKRRGKVD